MLDSPSQTPDRFNGGPGTDTVMIDGQNVTVFGDGTFLSYETFQVG